MSIQSLSIVVPGERCINRCPFCVSSSHRDIIYENRIKNAIKEFEYYPETFDPKGLEYVKALRYARDLGCTTVMLTGECEPQQNMNFLRFFFRVVPENLFNNFEIQTTGRGLDAEKILELVNLGVNTFSLSIASLDMIENGNIITDGVEFWSLKDLCKNIKDNGCLLRLSINLSDCVTKKYTPEELFRVCREEFDANQVTLRQLYKPTDMCPQSRWIEEHTDLSKDKEFFDYIKKNGIRLETLPYGMVKYSVDRIGTVADDDCMAKNCNEDIRYLILRPDSHLYTRWDDPASIIF